MAGQSSASTMLANESESNASSDQSSPVLQAILNHAQKRGPSADRAVKSPVTQFVTQYIQQRSAQLTSCSADRSPSTTAPGGDDTSVDTVELLRRERDELAGKVSEMSQQLASMHKQIDMMLEAMQKMQAGLSRHHSEKIAPEQLRLALGLPSTEDDRHSSDETNSDNGDDGSGQGGDKPAKKPRKRNNHGRSKRKDLPKVVSVQVPHEILAQGLNRFDLIGWEESSTLAYRRGGLFEFITRRAKFVPRDPKKAHTPRRNPLCEPTEKSSLSGASQASGLCVPHGVMRTSDGHPIFTEQYMLTMLPKEATSSYHNVFVDGALVRYRPKGNQACRAGPVLIAPLPSAPIDKGLADASLLAHLFVQKHVMHLPFYRQEYRFGQQGHRLSRNNMSRWQLQCGQLLEPLINKMWREAIDRPWFAMDATSTALQASPKLERGYVHVMISEAHSVLYRFSEKNDGDTLVELFGGAQGVILADSSSTHNGLFGPGKAKHAGCWAHARRHFVRAFDANEGAEAALVLRKMQKLFRVEARARDMSPGQRLAERILYAKPIVDELIDMADARYQTAEPDTHTRSGYVYLHNQAAVLRRFLSDGNVPMHNNMSERALRRMVKGRINWLFHGSPKHARAACNIASAVASAEHIGLDPELYLQELLTVLPDWPVRDVLQLAPENWLATRARLLEEGSLTYIDIATITGSMLRFPSTPSPSV